MCCEIMLWIVRGCSNAARHHQCKPWCEQLVDGSQIVREVWWYVCVDVLYNLVKTCVQSIHKLFASYLFWAVSVRVKLLTNYSSWLHKRYSCTIHALPFRHHFWRLTLWRQLLVHVFTCLFFEMINNMLEAELLTMCLYPDDSYYALT